MRALPLESRPTLSLRRIVSFKSQLIDCLPQWKALPKTNATPRRPLRLSDWQADWEGNLAQLSRHVRRDDRLDVLQADGHLALEHALAWEAAAQASSNLLLKGIDRGFDGAVLRQIYIEVAALWLDHAHLLAAAQHTLQQQGSAIAVGASLQPRTAQHYEYALQLLALGPVLGAQDLLPALVEKVLCFDTDRVLDYVSAPALGLVEASDEIFHPRPFASLFAPLREGEAFDPSLLTGYLQTQYRDFFQLAPKAQKRSRRLIGPNAWGYWALEVAAMVVVYGGDDAVLRTCQHYPADLVDYARR